MAKSKVLVAAELRIAALEAQLVIARTCYRELRDTVHQIKLNAQIIAAPRAQVVPVVTRYNDALGRVWIKTRIGNIATARLATESIAT